MKKLFFIITIGGLITVMSCSDSSKNIELVPQELEESLALVPKAIKNLNDSINPRDSIVSNNQELIELMHEDKINLNPFIKDTTKAKEEILACRTHISIDRDTIYGKTPLDSIKGSAFKLLYDEAVKLINQDEKHITGLKMEFGFDFVNKTLCLIYRPVVLNGGQEHAGTSVSSYTKSEGKAYMYNQSSKMFAPINDIVKEDKLTQDYRAHIRIKHSTNLRDTLSNFIDGIDVESMIFSFQEIFAVMYDNRKDTKFNKIFADINNPVFIYNCVREVCEEPNFPNKHGLLLSVHAPLLKHKLSTFNFVVFKKRYANLAHLCPPNCDNGTSSSSRRKYGSFRFEIEK